VTGFTLTQGFEMPKVSSREVKKLTMERLGMTEEMGLKSFVKIGGVL